MTEPQMTSDPAKSQDSSNMKKSHTVEKCLICKTEDPKPTNEIKFDTTFCCKYSDRKSMIDFCDKYHHAFQVKNKSTQMAPC